MNDSPSPWRFQIGRAVFVVGFATPLLIPWVAASDLPPSTKAVLSGLFAAGIPEVFSLVAVAILGKEGCARLKHALVRVLKRHGPPETVSRRRYRVGIVAFTGALLLGWTSPYAEHFLPVIGQNDLSLAIGGDVLLVSSLFVLGGEFWDKLRALFHYGAKAVFQSEDSR